MDPVAGAAQKRPNLVQAANRWAVRAQMMRPALMPGRPIMGDEFQAGDLEAELKPVYRQKPERGYIYISIYSPKVC